MKTKVFIAFIMAVSLLGTNGAAGFSLGDPFAEKTREGNEYFRQKKFDEALKAYKSAQVENPDSPEIFYNIANAFAQQEKYEEAIKNYEEVLAKETSPEIKAHTYYNMGNCLYRMSELAESNGALPAAINHLKKSVEAFTQAIRLAPDDLDAKFNYELAKKKLEELLKKQEQQNQEQNQSKKEEKEKQKEKEQQQEKQESQAEKKEEQQHPQQQSEKEKQEQAKAQQEEQKPEQSKDQQAQQMKKQEGKMTPEDVQRLLNALSDEEQQMLLQKKLLQQRFKGSLDMERDW